MVGVGEGQRLDAGKRGRQREFAQVGIVVHFDVQGVFQADRRENREPIVPKIAGIITKTNRIKSQSNYSIVQQKLTRPEFRSAAEKCRDESIQWRFPTYPFLIDCTYNKSSREFQKVKYNNKGWTYRVFSLRSPSKACSGTV